MCQMDQTDAVGKCAGLSLASQLLSPWAEIRRDLWTAKGAEVRQAPGALSSLRMYSSRRLNKNIVDGNAYCTVGDPYKDTSHHVPPRWKGKQMTTIGHPQNSGAGFFTKLAYASEPYTEMERYVKTQPLESRAKGFGSKDASRRGEFTSYIRTEQYRETLHKELNIVNKFRDRDSEERVLKKFADIEASKPKTFLYDIGRSKVTPFDPKVSRDRHFIIGRKGSRELGPYRPTSTDVGDEAWKWKLTKPEHGPISYMKNFYDIGHLSVDATSA